MAKKVLIVVDYQKDFVDGVLGFESAKNLDKGIAAIMKEYAEDENGVILCTYDTHAENYLDTQEGRKLPVEHCIDGTEGWELYGQVNDVAQKYKKDIVHVDKPTFGSINLANCLYDINYGNDRIESITLVGVVTNMCVISNAVIAKAACPEARIVIKKDLVDSFDKEMHGRALSVMESMQMDIE